MYKYEDIPNNPLIDILCAVAGVLESTVDNILQSMNIFTYVKKSKTREELLDQVYKAGLFVETLKLINSKMSKEKYNLTVR